MSKQLHSPLERENKTAPTAITSFNISAMAKPTNRKHRGGLERAELCPRGPVPAGRRTGGQLAFNSRKAPFTSVGGREAER